MKKLQILDLTHKKIIIYGAGVYGELAYRGLEFLGIRPVFFCDRYMAGKTWEGCPIISFEEMCLKYRDYCILIASAPYFMEMRNQLERNGFQDFYSIEELISLPIPNEKLSQRAREKKDNLDLYIEMVQASERQQDLILGHLEVVLTEKCSLRCRDCANLMQYYSNPENVDVPVIEKSLDRLLECVDRISELRLLGGEPLLYQELPALIHRYANHPKIGKIVIYTNGTIVPKRELLDSMAGKKVEMHLSDYGVKNAKIDSVEKRLSSYQMKYFVRKYDSWNDLGNLSLRERTAEETQIRYHNCVMANCYTLYRGRLYKCPRSAHGERLGAFHNKADESLDFLSETEKREDLRIQMKRLLAKEKSLTACCYCNGSNWHGEGVKAAVQISHVKELEEQ